MSTENRKPRDKERTREGEEHRASFQTTLYTIQIQVMISCFV